MFIRQKQIKNKHYGYLVENEWVRKKTRQRVVQYLGRILHVPKAPPLDSIKGDDILFELVEHELSLLEEEVIFDKENNSFSYKNRPVVLSLNGGFLCEYTLTEIMNAQNVVDEERPGTALATALANAGLRIPKEAFIKLYTEGKQ